ncbi:ankyrin repeat domain-containing protein [Amycolatopsis sp. NPDC004079]|uniref:ankyrin repeat domain-containing protein n=1 Tax=Amycolatopsis sp. NPDC004079 TaxID=3154549 RepID=UPI0033BB2D3E
MSPAHSAVEMGNVLALCSLLDEGVDVNEEWNGFTLLHHAVDREGDDHAQSGGPLHVDSTALLLARGADLSCRTKDFEQLTAEDIARSNGHWLAIELFSAWKLFRRID